MVIGEMRRDIGDSILDNWGREVKGHWGLEIGSLGKRWEGILVIG